MGEKQWWSDVSNGDYERRTVLRHLSGAMAGGAAVSVAGCSEGTSDGDGDGDGGTPTSDPDTPTDEPETDADTETAADEEADPWMDSLGADREFWVVMGDIAHRDSFLPSTTIVRAGDSVGIHLKNTGDEPHDFEIPAFEVAAEDVDPEGVVTRTFTASDPGVHPIECELHPTWMWGQLVVLPESGGFPTVDDRQLRITMGDVAHRDSFMPSTNVVVEGEEVGMTVKNTGDEPHDFEIPAFEIAAEDVATGEKVTRSFTADTPGIHEIECELHPKWMYGQLVVLPADGDFSRVATSDDRHLRIVMGDVAKRESFFPSTNVVKQGEEVEVTLRNTGDEVHDMDVEAFGIEVDVEAGKETNFTFPADEGGLHRILCELHPPEMNGQLWVVPE